MKRVDLGQLNGSVWLFGGALSNLSALQAFLSHAQREGVPSGRMICTGDLIGYCAHPVEVLEHMRGTGIACIAGNVERQLGQGGDGCGCGFAPGSTCDRLSAGWFGHADRLVSSAWRDWMEDLPDIAIFAHEGRRYAVVHGGFTDIARFLWPCSPEEAFAREITAIEAAAGPVDGVIAGHAGVAFERLIGGVAWINAGVIGMPPHDGRKDTRFVSLDADGARIRRLSYNVTHEVDAMHAAGLVQGYERTLETGIWPSQEVLPPEMRRG